MIIIMLGWEGMYKTVKLSIIANITSRDIVSRGKLVPLTKYSMFNVSMYILILLNDGQEWEARQKNWFGMETLTKNVCRQILALFRCAPFQLCKNVIDSKLNSIWLLLLLIYTNIIQPHVYSKAITKHRHENGNKKKIVFVFANFGFGYGNCVSRNILYVFFFAGLFLGISNVNVRSIPLVLGVVAVCWMLGHSVCMMIY